MRTPLVFRSAILAMGASLGLLLPGAAAAQRYMATGLPFFEPYHTAIVSVERNGTALSGTLAPPAGDPRPALPLSGSIENGVVKVTVGQGQDAYTVVLSENQRGLHTIWEETATVPDLDQIAVFRPPSGFSEPALMLQHDPENWCGRVYGGLALDLRAKALAGTPAAPAALADLDVVLVPQQGGTSLVKMKDIWSRLRLAARSGDDVTVDVALPLGTEAKTAESLRRQPEIAAVLLPEQCGEMALAVVPRAKLMDGDKISDAKLKAYAETLLARLLSGAAPDAAAGPRKFKATGAVAAGPTGPVYRATVSGDAEATRLTKGAWDQFAVTLQPVVTATDAADTISLVPVISDLKSARKSGSQPPADSALKPLDDSSAVAGIAHRLVSFTAASENSRCAFLTQAPFDEPEDSLSCTNTPIDDVSSPDDN